MKQIIRHLSMLPFVVALFDEEGAGGGGEGGSGAGDGGQNNGGQSAGGNQARNDRGQYARNDRGGAREYPQDLVEAHRLLDDQDRRIRELNDEAANRRRENKDLKKDLGTLQSRQSLVDQRAIRMEAREALRAHGVIDPDVVDLFLKHAGDAIKIDENTGDVVGVDGAIVKFKEAKAVFFKPADDGSQNNGGQGNGDGSGNGSANGNGQGASGAQNGGQNGGQGGTDTRGNATGTGASVNGGGNGAGGGTPKVADFKDPNVNFESALAQYARTGGK